MSFLQDKFCLEADSDCICIFLPGHVLGSVKQKYNKNTASRAIYACSLTLGKIFLIEILIALLNEAKVDKILFVFNDFV